MGEHRRKADGQACPGEPDVRQGFVWIGTIRWAGLPSEDLVLLDSATLCYRSRRPSTWSDRGCGRCVTGVPFEGCRAASFCAAS